MSSTLPDAPGSDQQAAGPPIPAGYKPDKIMSTIVVIQSPDDPH